MTPAWAPARFGHQRFARIADLASRFADLRDWPTIDQLNERYAPELTSVGMRLVEAGKQRPVRAPDGTIDPASLYEVRIVERGEIATRPRNLHDLLNAVVWAAYPRSKLALSRALAAIQRERARGRTALPATRSREHDRLALVDEGALLLAGGATWIFGHAIYEHAYEGRLDVRGAAVDLDVPVGATRTEVDAAFAGSFADLGRVVRRGPGIAVE